MEFGKFKDKRYFTLIKPIRAIYESDFAFEQAGIRWGLIIKQIQILERVSISPHFLLSSEGLEL
jgi:hypothetical protein